MKKTAQNGQFAKSHAKSVPQSAAFIGRSEMNTSINETNNDQATAVSVNKKETAAHPIWLCTVACLAALTSLFGVLALKFSYVPDSHYLTSSCLTAAFAVLLILSAVAAISSRFIFKKGNPITSQFRTDKLRFVYVLPAGLVIPSVAISFGNTYLGIFGNMIAICAILSAAYSLLTVFKASPALKVIFGIAQTALSALIIAALYLDFTIELNSHFKLLVQLGAIATILHTAADSRISLSCAEARAFAFLKSAALIFGLSSGVIISALFAFTDVFDKSYLCFGIFYIAQAASAGASLFDSLQAPHK